MSAYAADEAVVEQELTGTQALEFGEYCGFMAHYGARLYELAANHECPETAFKHLQAHAEAFLDRLHGS
ncbi:hypothetical protein ACFV3E_05915 [Streptomyces sp. NPDC059718]